MKNQSSARRRFGLVKREAREETNHHPNLTGKHERKGEIAELFELSVGGSKIRLGVWLPFDLVKRVVRVVFGLC